MVGALDEQSPSPMVLVPNYMCLRLELYDLDGLWAAEGRARQFLLGFRLQLRWDDEHLGRKMGSGV